MCLLFDEPGAEDVQQIMEGDRPVALPFVALMEIRYVLLRRLPAERVEQLITLLRASQAEIPESDPAWGAAAAQVKAGGGLSLADAWMAALALQRGAKLVHHDPEFESVPNLRSHWVGPAPARVR
jgi:predicted nucleic acid-binding protein